MTEEVIRERLARNLAYYRHRRGLTQTELSEKINYSDKSVSKWERGEGVPDIYVLSQLAEIFGVGVDDLLSGRKHSRLGAASAKQRAIVFLLSEALVWLVATVTFACCLLFSDAPLRFWLAFIYAIPVSAVVSVVFMHLWWGNVWQFLSVTYLIWSVALCLDLTFTARYIHLVYCIGAAVQVLACLWYLLLHSRRRQKQG